MSSCQRTSVHVQALSWGLSSHCLCCSTLGGSVGLPSHLLQSIMGYGRHLACLHSVTDPNQFNISTKLSLESQTSRIQINSKSNLKPISRQNYTPTDTTTMTYESLENITVYIDILLFRKNNWEHPWNTDHHHFTDILPPAWIVHIFFTITSHRLHFFIRSFINEDSNFLEYF